MSTKMKRKRSLSEYKYFLRSQPLAPLVHFADVWSAIMDEQPKALGPLLDKYGWELRNTENWEVYDIIVRFKRWDCLKVYLSRVPLWYLKIRYEAEHKLLSFRQGKGGITKYCYMLKKYIRDEAHRRAVAKALLLSTRVQLPTDLVSIIVAYEYYE